MDSATSAVKGYGNTAESASRASRDIAGNIDDAGGASQKTAGGIRDMAGALEGTRFEAVGQAAVAASTYFEAAAGAGDLVSASQTFLSVANLKATASTIANTAATIANTVATQAASLASKAWAVAQAALNVVLSANPIGIVIVAIIALVAAIVLAYRNSETFRDIVQAVFRAVGRAIEVTVDMVTSVLAPVWRVVSAAAKIAIDLVAGYFNIWWGVISTVVGLISDGLVGAFNTLRSVATSVFNAIMVPINAVRSAIDKVVDVVRDLIGFISNIHLPSLPSWVPFVGGRMAPPPAGGTLAATRTGLPAARRPAGRAGGSGGIVVNVSVPPTANPVETGRQIVAMVRRFERAAGAGWRTGTVFP